LLPTLFGKGFIEHNIIQHHPETKRLELVAGNAAWEIINQLGLETAYMFLLASTGIWHNLYSLNSKSSSYFAGSFIYWASVM